MIVNKVEIQGSPLWQNIWSAWRKVREGLTQKEPKNKEESFTNLYLEIQRFVNKMEPHGVWNWDLDFLYGL